MEKVTLVHAACSLSMRIPEAIRAKPVSKLLRAWTKEYERRAPGADTAGLGLECDGSPLPLDAAIGSLAPGSRSSSSSAARAGGPTGGASAAAPRRRRRDTPGRRDTPPARDDPRPRRGGCGTRRRRATSRASRRTSWSRRSSRRGACSASRSARGGARLGCATGGPCRVRRLPGSPPFPGFDARCAACFEARPAADFGGDAPELVSVVCPTTGDRASFHALLYANFARQERVPRRELVVFDTGAAPSPFFAALDDGAARYVHSTNTKLGLGAKRNALPADRNAEDRVAMFTALSHDLDDTPANIFLHMEHGRNTVPADSWDNCVEFRTPLDGDRVAAPARALAAAASVVEAVARERAARGPTRARPFVPKQRKFAIGKAKR
ncbi:hypothetical protein SO694_00018457 [Aureococcus anophagefferens]|uniref:Uncharacterized protein n=1 Tax=Aureococcus anophagefferens TaxID=44056 RepID=A0ABR1G0L3_AURAN